MSISVTTRKPRPGEQEGVDYYFLDEDAFANARDNGELLEHACVFGNNYGTPRAPVMARLEEGRDVLFDIDWQGTQQLSRHVPDDLVRVFILPPSGHSLEERLINRNQDDADIVAGRMAKAAEEISHWHEYDYVIVNNDINVALGELRAILQGERLRRERQTGLDEFVDGLVKDLKS